MCKMQYFYSYKSQKNDADSCCIGASVLHMQLTLPQESPTVRNCHKNATTTVTARLMNKEILLILLSMPRWRTINAVRNWHNTANNMWCKNAQFTKKFKLSRFLHVPGAAKLKTPLCKIHYCFNGYEFFCQLFRHSSWNSLPSAVLILLGLLQYFRKKGLNI